jgi:hypothetical protein
MFINLFFQNSSVFFPSEISHIPLPSLWGRIGREAIANSASTFSQRFLYSHMYRFNAEILAYKTEAIATVLRLKTNPSYTKL